MEFLRDRSSGIRIVVAHFLAETKVAHAMQDGPYLQPILLSVNEGRRDILSFGPVVFLSQVENTGGATNCVRNSQALTILGTGGF